MIDLDKLDKEILKILQNNCKISNATLAREVGLTPPATLERVKKLQNKGFILGYKAILDKKKLGKGLTCFIALHLDHHNKRKVFNDLENSLKELGEIEEFHLVTGRYDYLIKVNFANVDELKEFMMEKLTKVPYINRIETFVAISSMTNTNQDLIDEDE